MREAHGEYITFLDSDDWLEDNAIEILLTAQLQHPDKLIAANFYRISSDFTRSIFAENFTHSASYNMHDVAESYCLAGSTPRIFHSACAKIYSRQIIAHGIEFPEGIAFSEDAVFVIRYLHKTGAAFALNTPVYNMYERPGSAERSAYSPKMLQSQIDAHEIMINHPQNTPEVRKFFSISRTQLMLRYAAWGMSGEIEGISPAEIGRIRKMLRPYVEEYLSCEKLSVKNKLGFLCKEFLPVPFGRIVLRTWRLVKKLLGKR